MISALVVVGLMAFILILALCRIAAEADERSPSPDRPLFYCERCEQQTAMRISNLTATVVACQDHAR